ncbi:gephyrin-like molybdotransferase receptor GlpR [Streptomyces sp. NPDC005794]|uniref:divisome protein SepX/GlpR n=1 Tax=Streptomyces sp. NPDC005794 TaxID=3364733 RepID=UPI00368F5EF0
MPPCKPLYGVRVSSSGLIYAVIVGAWAAYLVPMWLRRQDELNEARPTERFSTAIRLLSGRAAMERRYAKELRERDAEQAPGDVDPDAVTDRLESVDVRAFSAPPAHTEARLTDPATARPDQERPQDRAPRPAPGRRVGRRPSGAESERERRQRSQVLARRRRTTTILFMAFTLGAVVAAVGGLRFLWAPAVPALLLSTYIVHLRTQERRRFVFTMDRRRAEVAAQRLRENRPRRHQPVSSAPAEPDEEPGGVPAPAPTVSPQEAGRRALVEQTDHAEWVDQQRERGPAQGDSWEPVPVPLPTYVTAPVAPRATGGVEVGDPETWSAARSSSAEPTRTGSHDIQDAATPAADPAPRRRGNTPRRTRDRGRTPLFDQYDDEDRPRAANE